MCDGLTLLRRHAAGKPPVEKPQVLTVLFLQKKKTINVLALPVNAPTNCPPAPAETQGARYHDDFASVQGSAELELPPPRDPEETHVMRAA